MTTRLKSADGGLSPPTRGNPADRAAMRPAGGSIPAHAGEPRRRLPPAPPSGVYPRPRGGTACRRCRTPSPSGSIPAHAGEPGDGSQRGDGGAVYPRPRGGTELVFPARARVSGLSPPTRGNRRPLTSRAVRKGSIPAHAGEPSAVSAPTRASTVYPRPRGGTPPFAFRGTVLGGLSPPTRGNHRLIPHGRVRLRSIPAHAGEPPARRPRCLRCRVYPRPRGGTFSRSRSLLPVSGLSPPTRGNPQLSISPVSGLGSIPAHAGEPRGGSRASCASWVYPRPRGGTPPRARMVEAVVGLSPPTRGNPATTIVACLWEGSIPAHAGEPNRPPARSTRARVYPRPRGGTD